MVPIKVPNRSIKKEKNGSLLSSIFALSFFRVDFEKKIKVIIKPRNVINIARVKSAEVRIPLLSYSSNEEFKMGTSMSIMMDTTNKTKQDKRMTELNALIDTKDWIMLFDELKEIEKWRKLGNGSLGYNCSIKISKILNLIMNKELNEKQNGRKGFRRHKKTKVFLDPFDVFMAINQISKKSKKDNNSTENLAEFLFEIQAIIMKNNNNREMMDDLTSPPPYRSFTSLYPQIADIDNVEPSAPSKESML